MNQNIITSQRILSKETTISNNTWLTGINNNDLIIGPSGGGKTRGYVIPNIIHTGDNLIIADTKGNLYNHYKDYLTKMGYKVMNLDLIHPSSSPMGFNPLSYVRTTKCDNFKDSGNRYNEDDISRIANAICPVQSRVDPVWDQAAQMYLETLILYTLNCLPDKQHNLCDIFYLLSNMKDEEIATIFDGECMLHPTSSFAIKYNTIKSTLAADKTVASVIFVLSNHLNKVANQSLKHLYDSNHQIDFNDFVNGKTILFLNVSDNDRSKDGLVNLFYTNAFQYLIDAADQRPDSKLPIPVRFIMDDFCTNAFIPDFDNLISVIRSREIYVSLIVQSISQLEGRYDPYRSQTIINNCDHLLYLGSNDPKTAEYFAKKVNRLPSSIECLPLEKLYIFARGNQPVMDNIYNINDDDTYCKIQEALKSDILSSADSNANNDTSGDTSTIM